MNELSRKFLSKKQFDFVNKYLANGLNAYDAAIHAGYSPSFASVSSKLLHNPRVKAVVSKAQETMLAEQSQAILVTYEKKVNHLTRIIEEYLPLDRSIPLVTEHIPHGIRALTELNKMQGHIAPDKRINMTIKLTKDRLKDASIAYDEF